MSDRGCDGLYLRVVGDFFECRESFGQRNRGRILYGVSILYVSETPKGESRTWIPREHEFVDLSQHPVATIGTICLPGANNSSLTAIHRRKPLHCHEIALQISARYAKARTEISVVPDALVQAEGRRDFLPVGPNSLADFGEGVGRGD